MSLHFQGLMRNLGTVVSGDKKLFYFFTRNSFYIMMVPFKPTRIGLCMYQLVPELENGLPILIHMGMMAVETVHGERAPVNDIIREYCDIYNGVYWLLILKSRSMFLLALSPFSPLVDPGAYLIVSHYLREPINIE